MKRFVKTLAMACVAALALAGVSAAGAQAERFTASQTGTLAGTQTSTQVLTFAAGGKEDVTCEKASTTGSVIATESVEQEVTLAFSNCIAVTSIGSLSTTFSNATLNLTANGKVHILNTITIHIGGSGIVNCNAFVAPQTPTGSVSYSSTSGQVVANFALTGIMSTGTGICPHGSTGTFTGSSLMGLGGGLFAWDIS